MKGKGEKLLNERHLLIYSGVDQNQRAKEGVGCIFREENRRYIKDWDGVSERILKIELELEKQSKTTVLIVYGPGEDEKAQVKDAFWEQLAELVEDITGRLLIIGDLNARVGKSNEETGGVIGSCGEDVINNNGKRLIDMCLINNLIITNTFFRHKDIHKYTREVINRNEKSIIDYVIVNKEYRKEILDTRVRRGAELYTDHYLVLSKIRTKIKIHDKYTTQKTKRKKVKIKHYKLREQEVAKNYMMITEREILKIKENIEGYNLEQLWTAFKNTILVAAKTSCGITVINKNKKKTSWWSEEIKAEIKDKKNKWRKYLMAKTNENYSRYKEQRTKVKEIVRIAKQKSWEDFGRKLETDRHGNQKLFYRALKNLRKGKEQTIPYLISEEGNTITDEEEMMTRWKQYFEGILHTELATEEYKETESKQIVEQQHHKKFRNEEVKDIIKNLKRGKAAGHDEITTEMLTSLGRNGIEVLTFLYNKISKESQIPKDWEVGVILPIYKKGNNRNCNNYRGITLLSTALKVYERLLDNRLKNTVDRQLEESQSGFRKGRGVQDHIFTSKQIIEKSYSNDIYVAFIDIQKAFDSVRREMIWNSLKNRGVDIKLIQNIASIYRCTRNYVRTNNRESDEFESKEGLRQGGVLSTTLFNIILDDVTKEVKQKIKKLQVGYRNMEPVYITECAFADDLMIWAKNETDLQHNLEAWNLALKQKNLNINIEKTKIMVIGKNSIQNTVRLNGKSIDQTDSFKYLGITIHKDGKNEAEINSRIENATKLYYAISNQLIKKKEVTRKTKLTVYKTIFKPTLIYGCETWTLTKQQISKIQAVEMKFLRAIKGVTRRDRIRNEAIREEEELEVEPVIKTIERQQLRWFGHVVRMENSRQPKKIWQAKPIHKRARGRPKKKWDDVILESLKKRNKSWKEGKEMAQDRKKWARFIR